MRNLQDATAAHPVSGNAAPARARRKAPDKPGSTDKFGLYDERMFQSLLSAERKRTERTDRPFVLSLIDVGRIWNQAGDDEFAGGAEMMDSLAESLHNHSRDIDTKGWYYQDRLIGVIYPETDRESLSLLEGKLRDALVDTLGDHFHTHVGVTWYCFPGRLGSWDKYANREAVAFYTEKLTHPAHKEERRLRRAIDIAGSVFGIVLFSPLFIVVPLLIKLTSKGPVFYRQQRIGEGGRRFTFLKFRSMRVDSKENMHKQFVQDFIRGQTAGEGAERERVYKITDDPRVTGVGRFLRRTSLDELPQFINVLRGDMSLVGPRPAIPYEVDEYQLWHRRRLFEGKPGITGQWQVEGRSSASFDEMVRMDLQYLERGNLWSYMKLIVKTPLALFSMRGAY